MEELALKNLQIDNPAEGVLKVTVHRPEQLNALDDETVAEIHRTFEAISRDSSLVLATRLSLREQTSSNWPGRIMIRR